MCEAVESYAEKYAEQKAENARLNNLCDNVKKLMTNMKLGAEQAMNLFEVNDKDREFLQKRL